MYSSIVEMLHPDFDVEALYMSSYANIALSLCTFMSIIFAFFVTKLKATAAAFHDVNDNPHYYKEAGK